MRVPPAGEWSPGTRGQCDPNEATLYQVIQRFMQVFHVFSTGCPIQSRNVGRERVARCAWSRRRVARLRSMATSEAQQRYREALEAWQKQLEGVHRLLLDGERLPPEQIKGLLGREARAKERYEAARRELLGIGE